MWIVDENWGKTIEIAEKLSSDISHGRCSKRTPKHIRGILKWYPEIDRTLQNRPLPKKVLLNPCERDFRTTCRFLSNFSHGPPLPSLLGYPFKILPTEFGASFSSQMIRKTKRPERILQEKPQQIPNKLLQAGHSNGSSIAIANRKSLKNISAPSNQWGFFPH